MKNIFTLCYYKYCFYGQYLSSRKLEVCQLIMWNCLLPILSTKQLWFLHPVRCNLSANLGKAVLTFSAERLITESTKEWQIFSNEIQGIWTMAVLSHWINPLDSAVIVYIYCTKSDFACVIGLYIMTIITKVGVVLSLTCYSTRYQDRLICLWLLHFPVSWSPEIISIIIK